ncbi:MAG: DegT/DnrJ/EryC1/StrS family aminotransferase, partial [Candidatus Bathyarchaeia archaeon]
MPAGRIPFCLPWITKDDSEAVADALMSQWLTDGPKLSQFEEALAEYLDIKHVVAVSNCTAALHLAMCSLDISVGDEVILPVFTFAATANAVLYRGAKPVLADIDPSTLNVSPDEIKNKLSKRTKAIIVVHYAGQPCDMRTIMEIANDRSLPVVEDCAHSLGATCMGKKTGTIGTAGCFSFYPTKNITTLEGGMITSNDDHVARKARLLRSHAMTRTASERERESSWFYDIVDLGYNYRLNEPQAALGMSQLRRLEDANRMRISAAREYNQSLAACPGIVTPSVTQGHVFHLYVIRVLKERYGLSRDELFRRLSREGIGLSVHYTPLH